jgi:LuxR family maltose regulon positive regulatory protein
MIRQASVPPLINTKLNRPRIRGDLVERPRLYAMWAAPRPLAIVAAPAGYGKTTLISDWVEAGKLRCAWLSLDAHDNEPRVFIRYVLSALERLVPAAVNADMFTPTVGASVSLAAVARRLADALEQVEDRFVLVLDDYHVITEPAIHLFLAQLLRYPPPCLRLVIATRVDPPLPLAAMRVKDQLTEIRARELRFTDKETAAYLTHELEYALDAETLANLADSTEGWIAGLHFAALLLRNQSSEAAAAFVRHHRGLGVDYLAAEVLALQPPEVQSFLIKTSILQRMCSPLCDALLGLTA